MKIDVTLELSNGRKIELTEAEVLELRNRLNAIYGWPTYQPLINPMYPFIVHNGGCVVNC